MSGTSRSREARRAAFELGRRFAVAGALLVALVSLLQHAPLWLASVRGSVTLILLVLGTRLGAAALARAIDSDLGRVRPKEEPRP